MLNFVICDDNLDILSKLSKMLESIFIKNNFDANISFVSDNADEILTFVNSNKADVLILDIELKSSMSGLDLAEKIRSQNKDCYLIFSTGHLEYAMIAYKLKTFDYLPKPITYERLEDTIIRLFNDINGLPKKYIKIDNKNTLIDENEIQYIRRDGMKLIYHTSNKDFEAYSSFNKMQLNLPNNFIRCHKSYVANINKITNIDPVSNTISFENNSTCEIGPKYKSAIMEVINCYGNLK